MTQEYQDIAVGQGIPVTLLGQTLLEGKEKSIKKLI